jgi:hypothetical protein
VKLFFKNLNKSFVEREPLYNIHYIKVRRRLIIILKNGRQLEKDGQKHEEFFRKRNFFDIKTQCFEEAL